MIRNNTWVIVRSLISGNLISIMVGDIKWGPPDLPVSVLPEPQLRLRLEPVDEKWRPFTRISGLLTPIEVLSWNELQWMISAAYQIHEERGGGPILPLGGVSPVRDREAKCKLNPT